MKIRQVIPDWIKGLAIVLMVYGHINHIGLFAALQKQAVGFIYTFHIPLFLIVSGFFFNTNNDPSELLRKLARRLLVPYLLFVSLYLTGLILIQKTGIQTSNLPPDSFLDFLKIVFFYPRGAYWFIHSIIVIQFTIAIAKMLTSRARLDDAVFLTISLFLLAMACNQNLLALRTVLYFLLGMAFGRFGGVLPTSVKAGLFLMGIIFIFFGEELYSFSLTEIVWCMSILTFLAGAGRSFQSAVVVSIFSWFGRNSLIVLVLHAMFIVFLKTSSTALLKLDQSGLLYSATVLIVTMFGSMLAAFLFDKSRVSNYLFGTKTMYSCLFHNA